MTKNQKARRVKNRESAKLKSMHRAIKTGVQGAHARVASVQSHKLRTKYAALIAQPPRLRVL